MNVIAGRAIAGQIAYGRLRFVRRLAPQAAEFSTLSWQEESERFAQARGPAL